MSAFESVESIAPAAVAPATFETPEAKPVVEQPSLRDTVTNSLEKYFQEIDGSPIAEVYDMVLAQMETPLLTSMMRFTRGNQSKAAILLGLSRGTLRKKLKIYDLENIHVTDRRAASNDSTQYTINDAVATTMDSYLAEMKGQPIADVYEMVLSEVEEPLMMAMMKYTRGNQSRAAILFGISRGTLRKKLKKYGLD